MYTKERLLDFFKEIYADKNKLIIGEEMSNYHEMVSKTLERFKKNTGKYPGILGLDIRYANLHSLGEKGIANVVKELTEYAEKGGIITASAHMSNPLNDNIEKHDYRGVLGFDNEWKQLYTKGTKINEVFTRELSHMADFLEALKKNGVPVIWRPLHEANGNWFWFCITHKDADGNNVHVSEEIYINVWKYIYNYFTDERGLDNLLWEYGPNIVGDAAADMKGGMTPVLYGYPGEYCDLVGFDWYSGGNYEIADNSAYKQLASTGKPFAFAEWGGPRAKLDEGQKQEDVFTAEDMLGIIRRLAEDGYSATYLMTWTSPGTINEMTKGDVLMNADGILGMEDIAKKI